MDITIKKNEFKKAFEEYYSKLETIYKITFETLPTISYDENDEPAYVAASKVRQTVLCSLY